MSRLVEIRKDIQDTQALIAQSRDALSTMELSPALLISLESLEKRQENLEHMFEMEASADQLDVCDYRLFSETDEDETPPLRVFSKTLLDYQNLFTQVFRSVHTNTAPKDRRVPADILQQTDLSVNYTFHGSFGIVLTLPNETMLYESDIDTTVQIIADLTKLRESDQIAAYAQKYGLATIRSLYEWTADQVKAGVGSDIQWKRGAQIKVESVVELDELVSLKEAIEATSAKKERTFDVTGLLVGADVATKTFHMQFAGAPDIRGKTDEGFVQFQVDSSRRYKATIRETKTVSYATEEEKLTFTLLALED